MSLERVRNLGIVAHIDAGKTTVSERILFYSGVERRMGEVHEGTAVMDYLDEERKRGITITAAATAVPWRGHDLQLIDTPGHVDFTVEVERCMRVLDGAVLVLNGVAGVQAQSETVWRQMRRHRVKAIAFVNQLDRGGADYFRSLGDLRKRLGVRAVAVQVPLGAGRDFRRIVDLVTLETLEFPLEEQGRHPRRVDLPHEAQDDVALWRAELLEALAEEDPEILADLLEERPTTGERIRAALRRAVLTERLLPVLAGAALKNVGIQPLLDAIVDYLPSPLDVAPPRALDLATGAERELVPDEDAPTVAYAFKLIADANEDLLFARVYQGVVRPGDKLFNPRTRRAERIARVYRMHADAKHALERARPGDIVALTGTKQTVTGDTLTTRDDGALLERIEFPEPVVTRVVEPESSADRERLGAALARLAFEDPTFLVREDAETGQWLVAGMGELHLEIKEHRLRDDFHLRARVGTPRVAYREALLDRARSSARVDRPMAGREVFGAVELEIEPRSEGASTVDFEAGVAIPDPFRAAIHEALRNGLASGPRFGYPLAGVGVRVVGGESHPERDAEVAFAQAAGQALRDALERSRVALLEPMMRFEVVAPADFMSGILGELNAKRADLSEVAAEGELRRAVGTVALFHMFGFATTLRSLSQGRASFSLEPAGFRPVPEAELAARGMTWT